jgi:hypothetical protein
MGSSCAAGFDRYWAELMPALTAENWAIQALYWSLYSLSETGTGREPRPLQQKPSQHT